MKRKPWIVHPTKWGYTSKRAADLDEAVELARQLANASGGLVEVCWAPAGVPLSVEKNVWPQKQQVVKEG